MNLQVKPLQDVDFDRWDAFVEKCPAGTFFHRAGWKKVIERAFGHETHYLYAEQDGEIVAVLPLTHVKSLLFGNNLVSNPFCVYGGVASIDEQATSQLIESACELAASLSVGALELRNLQTSGRAWPVKDLYVTFRKDIDQDPEINLKAIPRKQRAMVRKGIKAGLQGEEDSGHERLYRVYSESVRNLGTPVFSSQYLQILMEVFGDDCGVLMITREGQDIAGVLSFYFRDEVLPYYGGSTSEARAFKGNDFMYWDLMCRAAERGVRVFDYGRSKIGTGSYSFKKNWGFTPQPLSYEYFLVKAKQVPEINPMNPKYQLFIKGWKQLPLPLANFIGPFLARNLG